MNYEWPDGQLKWINGSERKWDCVHVSKAYVLVDTPNGLHEWNTDRQEPPSPYRYVYLSELFSFLGVKENVRGPMPECECKKQDNRNELDKVL